MKLIQRIGYYFGGFSIGLVILAFFLGGKKTSCAYGPDARVLKNISSKHIVYSNMLLENISENEIDTTAINLLLKKGDINFSKSKTRREPCSIYAIEGYLNDKEALVLVENCDSIATIINLVFEE